MSAVSTSLHGRVAGKLSRAWCPAQRAARPCSRASRRVQLAKVAASPKGGEEEGEEAWAEFDELEEEEEYIDDASCRLYLDSADVSEWNKWAETGMFYGEGALSLILPAPLRPARRHAAPRPWPSAGFTTNPSILKRDKVQCTIPSMRHLASEVPRRRGRSSSSATTTAAAAVPRPSLGQRSAAAPPPPFPAGLQPGRGGAAAAGVGPDQHRALLVRRRPV